MDKKSKQLGMNFSTASARLDRMILFMLVKECNRDTCYRCNKKIERYQDLSTEHKEPWQDIDSALFWDLDNISFSHRSCNAAAGARGRLPGNEKASKAPFGTVWCSGHKDYLPKENFHREARNKSGFSSLCKKCYKEREYPGSYGRVAKLVDAHGLEPCELDHS